MNTALCASSPETPLKSRTYREPCLRSVPVYLNRQGLTGVQPVPCRWQRIDCDIEGIEARREPPGGLGTADEIAEQNARLLPEDMGREEHGLVERRIEREIVIDDQQSTIGRTPQEIRIPTLRRQ